MGNRQIYLDREKRLLQCVSSSACFFDLSIRMGNLIAQKRKPKYLTYQLVPHVDFWKIKQNREKFVSFVKSLYHFGSLDFTCDPEFTDFTVDLEKVSGFNTFALFMALRYMEEFGSNTEYFFNYTDNFDLTPHEAFVVFHYLGVDGNYNHHFYGLSDKATYTYLSCKAQSLEALLKHEPEIPNKDCFLKDQTHNTPSLWSVFSPIKHEKHDHKKALTFLFSRRKDKKLIKSIENVNEVLQKHE